jgi:hypothetical protein
MLIKQIMVGYGNPRINNLYSMSLMMLVASRATIHSLQGYMVWVWREIRVN